MPTLEIPRTRIHTRWLVAPQQQPSNRMISERASIFGRPTAVGSACGPWGQTGYSQSDSGGTNNTNGGTSASGMSALAFNPYAGQPDYSAAWAEYYRRQGMHDYADSIVRQGQQQQVAQVTSVAMMPQQHGVAPSMISVQGQPATHEQYEYNQQWQQWQQRQAWQQQQGGNPNQSTGVYASSQQMQAASAPGYPSMPQ
ncbi:hypothetical protein CRM22_001341 [Opisthorchis felineus]|uniref:Far upstream element-binding protein C-terminal domain-containing protein n=1 Tax=Opisthorchis felineus TaxID=147828 RepID=A0A4S2MH34_OPIFE|nr:hypothetical protein CRM22_001341 [Opisthorchis felineus]